MRIIKFEVIGNPTPKGRPRFSVRGKHVMAYTPKKTKIAEHDFKMQILAHRPSAPFLGAVILKIIVYRAIPKSMSKKKQVLAEAGLLRPIVKPDLDNYEKLVCDSMNKIFYNDDSQIVDCHTQKYYSVNPHTIVEIIRIDYDEVK